MAKIIVDENIIIEAAILSERAKVLADDLTQGYFSMSDGRGNLEKSKGWRLEAEYGKSRIHCEIIRDFSYDAQKKLEELLEDAPVYNDIDESESQK